MDQAEESALEEQLSRAIGAYHEAALLYAAVKLGLAEKMGARGWQAGELAQALGLSPPHLARLLRGLSIIGICEERADGRFAATPFGQSLTPGSRLAAKVQIVVEQYWHPWANLVSTLPSGKPAFEQVFGMSVADWRREHVEQGRQFESYLIGETFDQANSIIEVLESAVEAKRIAAIGGGCGAILVPLLIAFPHLTGILFERPHIVELAKPFLRTFDQFALPERVELVAGDIRAAIPVRADLYVLNGVLQQYDDADARTILANCRAAMPEGTRLVIIERLLPERPTDDPAAVMLDLHMMAITGGRVRSLAEFDALVSAAGLTRSKVIPTSCGFTVIEAVTGATSHR